MRKGKNLSDKERPSQNQEEISLNDIMKGKRRSFKKEEDSSQMRGRLKEKSSNLEVRL